ncbi:MAG TPA: sulfite exporter TauE/SafE family protein [Solirubrobacteraceae bacterium]|nr:sulfite exporter TauE/SafE family protein [Solirubrobacteraceae bacterium]
MSFGEVVAFALAGAAAGGINTVVGSGTLITFPVLLAFGYAPVTANVTNNVGLVPGSVSGAIGYRRELRGQRSRALRLGSMSLLGGLTGAILLLVLPSSAFKAIVPVFIAIALVLTLLQPRLAAALQRRELHAHRGAQALVPVGVYCAGIYGGYFGAAQSIILLAFLGVMLDQDLQRTNALKNLLAAAVNGAAALYFVFAAHVDWGPAAIIACASVIGAQGGARVGRRLPPAGLRAVVVAVGCFAIVRLLV